MLNFNCPFCGKRLHVKEEFAGKRARCPGCQQIITVPQIAQPEQIPMASVKEDIQPTRAPRQTFVPPQPPPTANQPQSDNGPMIVLSTKIVPGVTAGFALLAIILFFLPWIQFSCAKTEIGSQSGFQIATGGVSLSSQGENLKNKNEARNGNKSVGEKNMSQEDSLGSDWPLLFVPAFLLCVILLGVLTIAKADGVRHALWLGACGLCLVAIILTVVYLAVGFAAERSMDKAKADAFAQSSKNTNDPFAATGAQVGASIIGVERTPVLYFFVTLLILTCLSTAGAWLLLARLKGVSFLMRPRTC
jgi:hypothetical protein